MGKRFIDTELWDKEKFNSCTEKQKLLALFITCKCDAIGIFKVAPMLITAYIGSTVTEEEILSIPMDIEKLNDGSYWLSKFCSFQYGVLSEKCNPHKRYIEMLKSKGLFKRVTKGLVKGSNTLEEEDKDKEEEKDKDKSRKKPEKTLHLDCLYFTEKERGKLKVKYIDTPRLDAGLEKLNNYLMSNGFQKKYKSHYHVMIDWVFKKVMEGTGETSHKPSTKEKSVAERAEIDKKALANIEAMEQQEEIN